MENLNYLRDQLYASGQFLVMLQEIGETLTKVGGRVIWFMITTPQIDTGMSWRLRLAPLVENCAELVVVGICSD